MMSESGTTRCQQLVGRSVSALWPGVACVKLSALHCLHSERVYRMIPALLAYAGGVDSLRLIEKKQSAGGVTHLPSTVFILSPHGTIEPHTAVQAFFIQIFHTSYRTLVFTLRFKANLDAKSLCEPESKEHFASTTIMIGWGGVV